MEDGNTLQSSKPPMWFIRHFSMWLELVCGDDVTEIHWPALIKASSRENARGASAEQLLGAPQSTARAFQHWDLVWSPEEGFAPRSAGIPSLDKERHWGMGPLGIRSMREWGGYCNSPTLFFSSLVHFLLPLGWKANAQVIPGAEKTPGPDLKKQYRPYHGP